MQETPMRYLAPLFAALLPLPAIAQQCADRATVESLLRDRYGETVQSQGLDVNGTMMHVWANLQTGSWSVTATNAGGLTCLVGAGNYYENVNEPQGVDG
jgi:hypothetical protein